mgnify:CR=1 FL=1
MQVEKDKFEVALSQICCQEEEISGWILGDRGQAVDNIKTLLVETGVHARASLKTSRTSCCSVRCGGQARIPTVYWGRGKVEGGRGGGGGNPMGAVLPLSHLFCISGLRLVGNVCIGASEASRSP